MYVYVDAQDIIHRKVRMSVRYFLLKILPKFLVPTEGKGRGRGKKKEKGEKVRKIYESHFHIFPFYASLTSHLEL